MTATLLASFPSPAQGVWFLGPFPVRAYALCIIAGIVAALVIGDRRWVARGGEPGVIYDIALWAVTFGLVGGRLYHVLTDWNTYFGADGAGFSAALRIWDGGLGIWGAVALGGVGAWIACRRRGIPLPAFGDAIAPGIILAQAIGRLGNYFNQELYGRETTLPWGLEIYERRNASGAVDFLNGVSTGQLLEVVHPTFLYELLWNLLVFVALLVIDRRFNIGHGRLFALYVAGYCVGRFWIELLRSDFATEIAGVRVNSFTATFVFIGAVVYIMAAPRGREDPATLRGNQDGATEPAVEGVVKDLAVGASTTGVVAAATVAAEEDRADDDAEVAAGGVGSVDEDELGESVADASEAHEVAVAGEAEADAVAAEDVADESSVEDEQTVVGGVGSVGEGEFGESVAEADEVAAEVADGEELGEPAADAVAADVADEEAVDVASAEDSAVGGVGSVDEAELGESVADASEAHEVAVAGEAEADEVAAEVADGEELGEPAVDDEADGVAAEDVAAESSVEDKEAVVGGVGSVDEGELGESVADASDAHEAAVAGEAEADAVAAEVAAEEAVDVASAEDSAVGGVGSVGEGELGEAVADASDAHEAAVAGEAVADAVATEVSDEEAADVYPSTEAPAVGGVGSVDEEELDKAVADASAAHDVAVDGGAEADDVAAEVADAAVDSDEKAGAEEAAALAQLAAGEPSGVGGLGSVEGDEANDVREAISVEDEETGEAGETAEGEQTDEKTVTEADQSDKVVAPPVQDLPPPPSAAQRAAEVGTRVRQWVRRRRNR
ncbi:prolipoprotein diacylglyceryl transferase [Mycobacterium sp. SMC-4]|uniref:prolipoprotein diacylglyceryl transferase n=1 Tax=Mycobacterium sp. SMC-4 TaxID=2857059 RepID=UPI003D05A374